MSAATKPASSPRAPSRPVCPAVAARLARAAAGGRPLTPEEYDLARFVVRRWTSARAVVAQQYGTAEATDSYRAATDRGLLAPADRQSYARFTAFTVAEPRTIERAVWGMLRAAEVDVVRLVEALNAEPAGACPRDGADLTIDGRRFSVAYLDGAREPRDARLIVD